jgi:hypothetical protein
MPKKEPDTATRLEQRLKDWEKDHLEGRKQVLIRYKPRNSSMLNKAVAAEEDIRLDEFSDTRITFHGAVTELDLVLRAFLHSALNDLAVELGRLGMPPKAASDEYESQSWRTWKEYVHRFSQCVADLRSALKDRWDEYEHPFSGDEIDAFTKNFKFLANQLRKDNVSKFKLAAWTTPQPAKGDNPKLSKVEKVLSTEAATRRRMVNAYIDEVLAKTGKRITRTAIWKRAGYQRRTEFERWERNDAKRSNKAANERFTRLLLVDKPHLK